MNWSLLLSAFIFIFLAALPGRTTFLLLLMAARGRPWALFWGAICAFAVQGLISVALGNLFSFLSPALIEFGAGVLFVYFAVHFWRDSQKNENIENDIPIKNNSVFSTFLIIFAAEWGDVSQVAIASFSARNTERVIVFIGATLAMWLIVVITVMLGTYISEMVKPTLIQKFAALGFVLTGIYLVIQATVAWIK
jgi:putative Ca2+/H+ antiporter (TMEM165/GDT1 family)